MRTYTIHYLVEQNDECVDKEHELQAEDFVQAVLQFINKVRLYKRITATIEQPQKIINHGS